MDDYQDCGTRPIDVRAIGVDFYVTGTLKYLLGPPGLAFLYVRKELQDTLIPTMTGWFAQRQPFAFDVKHLDRAPTARKFKGGSPPIPNIYAAKRSLALIEDVGRDAIAAHVASLTQYLLLIRCTAAAEMCELLAKQGIVVSSRHDGLRVSLHLYNTLEDVDALLYEIGRNRSLFNVRPRIAELDVNAATSR